MAKQRVASVLAVAFVLGAFAAFPAVVQSIGVCYGVVGNNLPTAKTVVQLYKSKGISSMRIYFPDTNALQALGGTNIRLIMDVPNSNLSSLASSPSAAAAWVKTYVQAYPRVSFRYIAVGNEAQDPDTAKILPAMKNLNKALSAVGLGSIKMSTSLRMDAFSDTFPPSNGIFTDTDVMVPIAQFLDSTGAPLLVNVYPYFAYKGDGGQNIHLDYATFQPGSTVFDDGNGLTYTNLFDAMVDSIYAALDDADTPNVPVVVSESGWPSSGGFQATVQNAQMYNQNLIKHIGAGTPRNPAALETYVFAMFNENLKTGDPTENHFGLFNPDKSPAYRISF